MQSYTVKILWYILTIWVTMEYKYKLFKRYSSVNAYKNSFINRIRDIWNTLPDTVVP